MGGNGRDEDPELWERQPGETSLKYQQFLAYRDQGRARTLQKAAEVLTKSAGHIRNIAADYDWSRRCHAWDAEQDRLWELEQAVARREMARRHAQLASGVLAKVVGRLQELQVSELTPNDVIRWFEVATKVERQARGEPTETIAHTGKDGGPVDVFGQMTPAERSSRAKELADELQRRGLLPPGQ